VARGKPGPKLNLPGPRPVVTRRPRLSADVDTTDSEKSMRLSVTDGTTGIPFTKGPPKIDRGSRKFLNLSRHFIVTEQDLRGRALSGSKSDSDRTRNVKSFYEALPDRRPIYADITKETEYVIPFVTPSRVVNIGRYSVPDNRTLIIDDVVFFATPEFGLGLVAPGDIEGYVQFVFKIGGNVPVQVINGRLPAGNDQAGFPFLNDRIGAKEVTFSLYANTGQDIELSYINRAAPPVPLATVGARVRGWLIDTIMFEEIRQQQE